MSQIIRDRERTNPFRKIMTPQTQLNNHNYDGILLNLDNNNDNNFVETESPTTKSFQELNQRIDNITLDRDTPTINEITKQESFDRVKSQNTLLVAMEILDGTFEKVSYKEYANYLGKKSHDSVLYHFVDLLKPLPYSLLSVLYKLAGSLYLIAEAQNIDRILEEVSKQWISSHKETIWKDNYKICHIILFSLLILNSDLHNEEIKNNHHRFSSEMFVTNTLAAVDIELRNINIDISAVHSHLSHELTSYYEGLKHNALPVLRIRHNSMVTASRSTTQSPRPKQRSSFHRHRSSNSHHKDKFNMSGTRSLYSSKSRISLKDDNDNENFSCYTADWKYHHNMKLPSLYKKESFDAKLIIGLCQMWTMDNIVFISDISYQYLKRSQRQSFKSIQHNITNSSMHSEAKSMLSIKDDYSTSPSLDIESISRSISSPSTPPSSSPSSGPFLLRWLKKKRPKHLQGSNGHTPSNKRNSRNSVAFLETTTKWVPIRLLVNEGRIYIFKSNDPEIHLSHDIERLKTIPQVEYYVLNLIECTAELVQANVIQSSRQTSSMINFNVKFPPNVNDESLMFQFQISNRDLATSFVNCINFWAARLSSLPDTQFEIVSNEEYGWSPKILHSQVDDVIDLRSIRLSKWQPLLTMDIFADDIEEVNNGTNIREKLNELKVFLDKLDVAIDEHNDMKPCLIARWNHMTQFDSVMNNWNTKYLFLNNMYQKQIIYYRVLEDAISQYIEHT